MDFRPSKRTLNLNGILPPLFFTPNVTLLGSRNMLTARPDEPAGAESLEGVGGLLNYLKTLQQLSSLFCSLFFGDQTLLKNIKIIRF